VTCSRHQPGRHQSWCERGDGRGGGLRRRQKDRCAEGPKVKTNVISGRAAPAGPATNVSGIRRRRVCLDPSSYRKREGLTCPPKTGPATMRVLVVLTCPPVWSTGKVSPEPAARVPKPLPKLPESAVQAPDGAAPCCTRSAMLRRSAAPPPAIRTSADSGTRPGTAR
jgi:hypothetical protein